MTPNVSSDLPMSATDPRFWLRLALGLLVMVAAPFALAVMGWLVVCVVIARWILDVWMTPRSIVSLTANGLLFGLPALVGRLFLGAFAFFIGDAILCEGQ